LNTEIDEEITSKTAGFEVLWDISFITFAIIELKEVFYLDITMKNMIYM